MLKGETKKKVRSSASALSAASGLGRLINLNTLIYKRKMSQAFLRTAKDTADMIFTFAKYFAEVPIEECNGLDDCQFISLLVSCINNFVCADDSATLSEDFINVCNELEMVNEDFQD